jgi:hypothetical protein
MLPIRCLGSDLLQAPPPQARTSNTTWCYVCRAYAHTCIHRSPVTTLSVFIPRGKNEVSHKALIQIAEIMKFLLNIPNTPVDSYGKDSHAMFHAPCIPRIVSYEPLHVTLVCVFMKYASCGCISPTLSKEALGSKEGSSH